MILVCAAAALIGVFVYRFVLRKMSGSIDENEYDPNNPSDDSPHPMHTRVNNTTTAGTEKPRGRAGTAMHDPGAKSVNAQMPMRSRCSKTAAVPGKEADNEEVESC